MTKDGNENCTNSRKMVKEIEGENRQRIAKNNKKWQKIDWNGGKFQKNREKNRQKREKMMKKRVRNSEKLPRKFSKKSNIIENNRYPS